MALRGTAYGVQAGSGNAVTINVSGISIQNGDFVILCAATGGGTTDAGFPAGFTTIAGLTTSVPGVNFQIGWKIASSEPSTYTLNPTPTITDYFTVQCVVLSGRSGTITASAVTVSSAALSSPISYSLNGVTAAALDDVVAFIATQGVNPTSFVNLGTGGGTGTPPSGFGNVLDIGSVASPPAFHLPTISSACKLSVSAGSTGALTGSLQWSGGSTTNYCGAVLSIAAGTPTITVQPTNQSALIGQTATFSVTATSSTATSSVTDAFTRAAENPITTPWGTINTGFGLQISSSGVVKATSSAAECCSAWLTSSRTFSNKQSAEITVGVLNNADWPGAVVFASSAGGGRGYVIKWDSTPRLLLYKMAAGAVGSNLTFTNVTVVTGDKIKIQVDASSGTSAIITWYLNGTLQGTYTDSTSPYVSGQPGMYYAWSNTNSTTITGFTAEDFTPSYQWVSSPASQITVASEVAQYANYTGIPSGTTETVTITVGAGDSIDLYGTGNYTVNPSPDAIVTSSPSATWVQRDVSLSVYQISWQHWTADNLSAGTYVITMTWAAAVNYRALLARRITNTSGYDSVASAAHATNFQNPIGTTAADAVTTGLTSTLSKQPALISAMTIQVTNSTDTPSAGTGFSTFGATWPQTNNTAIAEHKRVTSTAALAATFTSPTTTPAYFSSAAVFREGARISGATSSSYTTGTLASSNNGTLYSVDCINTGGTTTSNTVRLLVSSNGVGRLGMFDPEMRILSWF